jgi:hypothetical protein
MSTRSIHWTEDTKTMKIRTDIPDFFIEFGQQMVIRVKNDTENLISTGTVVLLNGSQTFPTLEIADYSSYLTSEGTLGFVAHNMSGNTDGYVVTKGILRNVDLSNFLDGDEIYLYSGGTISNIKPIAPLPEVYLGTVIKSGVNGILNVDINLGFELEELHNIKITNPSNGDVLVWDTDESVWTNKTVGSISGNTNWTIDFMDSNSIDIYPAMDFKITSIVNIKYEPVITILVNDNNYTLGQQILSGDKITITSNINSVILLNIEE